MARLTDRIAMGLPGCGPWRLQAMPREAAGTPPPAALADAGRGMPAQVPGTVAAARRDAGLATGAEALAQDHWFWTEGPLPAGGVLVFEGIATLAEIWLDGVLAATSRSMYRAVEVTLPPGGARRLALCCRALASLPAAQRAGRPPRWRARLAGSETLRHVRTTLLGHMPGWDGGVPVIGPYRPVWLRRAASGPSISHADIRTAVASATGEVTVRLTGAGLEDCAATLSAGGRSVPLKHDGTALHGVLQIPEVRLWWPHTHGEPALYALQLDLEGRGVDLGRVGFRSLRRRDGEGFGLVVNGVEVFCRGAVWTGADACDPHADGPALQAALARARDGGMNMLRVPGMALYESPGFLQACDALGILVWHDFMFARFDYPDTPGFLDEAAAEARDFLDAAQASPSLAVLCGGMEVAQSAAMAGRPPAEWSSPLFDAVLAEAAAALRPDVLYVAHAPGGGTLPFAAAAPVAHYFGVGGYLRPPEDLDSAGVAFAAECLAFANPPDPAGCRALGGVPGDRGWRTRVTSDLAASWDFEDVRDHYVASLFGRDPALLRRLDPQSWLAHGRAAVALLMERALGTWRTDGVCGGALVLMLQDRAPGAGWGLVGHDGRPKSAFHALARAARPLQVVLRDNGQNGVTLHVLNETGLAHEVQLRLRGLAPDGGVEELARTVLQLPMHSARAIPAVELMGRWRDLAYGWTFGPAAFRVLGASMTDALTGALLSESTLFPAGPALPMGACGLTAEVTRAGEGWALQLGAAGFAQFVQVDDDHAVPDDDHFHLWPGETRRVGLAGGGRPQGVVSALNAAAPAHYRVAA